jgi:uncharacterized protein YdeI (BOF family)
MMKQTLFAAILALAAAPALASGGAVATPASAQAAACTQLELSVGLRGADCGRYTVAQIIAMDDTMAQD